MADWYASSAAYAAVPQWAATTAYTVGQFVRALATPAQPYQYYVFRCTTAGTSTGTEPTWTNSGGDGATIASGTATFTNVTGRSAYGWSAAAGRVLTMTTIVTTRLAGGDRLFVSSDHSESIAITSNWVFASTPGYLSHEIISVNRAGSVPPVAADEQSGAAITQTLAAMTFDNIVPAYWQGFTFSYASNTFTFSNGSTKALYFKNCAFIFTNASGLRVGNGGPVRVVWDNTTVKFAHIGQRIGSNGYPLEFIWLNTPSAIDTGGTIPTNLFNNSGGFLLTCRGVDLSALTTTLILTNDAAESAKVLLDSCRIASGLVRYSQPSANYNGQNEVELVNCYDGTNIINERSAVTGALTTERSTTLSGGAQDDVGAFSLKMVSNANADKYVTSLESFWFDVENTAIGSSKTATVEIISSASLNNVDIQLLLEYMGTSGSSIASFSNSLATALTASAALTTSSATWNNPPSTPVKQLLQITFTPQVAGRVRGLVRLGKVSATVWVNPQIAIT